MQAVIVKHFFFVVFEHNFPISNFRSCLISRMLPELSCIWNNLLIVSIETSRPDLLHPPDIKGIANSSWSAWMWKRLYGKECQAGRRARAEAFGCCLVREQQTTTASSKSVMKHELIKIYFPAVKLRQSYHYKIMSCSDSYSKIIDPTFYYTGVFPQVSILVCFLWEFEETLPFCYCPTTVKLEHSHLRVKLWLWNPKPKLLQMLWISFTTEFGISCSSWDRKLPGPYISCACIKAVELGLVIVKPAKRASQQVSIICWFLASGPYWCVFQCRKKSVGKRWRRETWEKCSLTFTLHNGIGKH